MRKAIFCFLLCLPASFANAQHASKTLTVTGFAEQAIRADEIYYSLVSLDKAARLLRKLDSYLAPDSFPYLHAQTANAVSIFQSDNCIQADSVLHDLLDSFAPEVELVEQELYDEIGVPAASDQYLLKIKSPATFKLFLARLETYPCFIGELVRVKYSRPEALRQQLTLQALRDARKNATEMLALLGHRIRSVQNIDPARVSWENAFVPSGENPSPFDPKLNRTLELVCRVQVTVQFRFK